MGLDSVDLIIRVEKTFDISIPDRLAEKILTVGDMHDAVWTLLLEKDPHQPIVRENFETYLNEIIADQIGVDVEELGKEKSFTNDLGVD